MFHVKSSEEQLSAQGTKGAKEASSTIRAGQVRNTEEATHTYSPMARGALRCQGACCERDTACSLLMLNKLERSTVEDGQGHERVLSRVAHDCKCPMNQCVGSSRE